MSPSGFSPFAIATVTDANPRSFVAGFSPPAPGDRGPAALRPRRIQVVQPRTGLVVGGPGADDHDRRQRRARPPGSAASSPPAAGAAGSRASGSGATTAAPGSAIGETTIDGGRVDLTEYLCQKVQISGEWRGHPDAALPDPGLGLGDDRHDPVQRRPPHPRALRDRLRRQRRLRRPGTVLIDNNPPAHPHSAALAGGDGWRRVERLRPLLGQSRPGPGEPDLGRLLADHRAGGLRHRGQARARAERRLARRSLGSGRRHLHAPPLAARRSRQRRRLERDRGPAAARQRRARESPSRPTPDREPGSELPETRSRRRSPTPTRARRGARSASGGSAPRTGPSCRPSSSAAAPRRLGAAGRGRSRGTSGRAPICSGPTRPTRAGNTASTTRRADGTEMALRRVAARGAARRAAAASRAKTRLFARLRWRHRSGPRITVPFDAAAILSGRLVNADGAGLAGRRLRVVSRPSRGALAESRDGRGPHRAARWLPAAARGGAVAAHHRQLRRRRRPRRLAPPRHRPAGARRPPASAPRRPRSGPAQVVRFSGRVDTRGAPIPRRGKLVAIQYYESAGRRWRPVLFVRSDRSGHFRARYRFRYVSGAARIRFRAVALAEERWPYSTGASAPVVVSASAADR